MKKEGETKKRQKEFELIRNRFKLLQLYQEALMKCFMRIDGTREGVLRTFDFQKVFKQAFNLTMHEEEVEPLFTYAEPKNLM